MNFSFHPEAEAEFLSAIDFYENCEEGLGYAFSREVFAAVNRILRYPEAWPEYTSRSRRCFCKRFPYAVVYRYSKSEVVIFAVMHQKREPNYWKDRL